MKNRLESRLPLLIFLCVFMSVLIIGTLTERAKLSRLNSETITDVEFREQQITDTVIKYLRKMEHKDRGKSVGLYLLDKNSDMVEKQYFQKGHLSERENIWKERPAWNSYRKVCEALWNDVIYFPVTESTKHENYQVTYVDSWMFERDFDGKRGHEGCDIMASEDKPGLYPIVSMTDGTVVSKGWLTKGGYRLGILAPSGAYFYYAHLDSYAKIEEGDTIRAGDVIGFMGDSGYGPEGTTGMFPTHLHLGIYLYPEDVETSYNPYWILRMIEEKKLSCSF